MQNYLPILENIMEVASEDTFALTVTSGSGDGDYAENVMVPIVAAAPQTGKKFKEWTATAGTLTSATSASTTFKMPGEAATVEATYEDV